ncbi:general secretion pathway protein N [Luteimonas cucumeris]|uniref:General secretion pathway protein N n=1 Tax=Luteimonas cucumeris TaxID=985012 RepID=A0A562LBP1_9GAMM|nr:general secretion pathway protein GspN [Luteimonas cucumeris]TWI05051.1 general secretion pathway protein N [Luteimonas cucumeris]
MRADSVGPRTWLLAAIAGWALLLWVLAMFGMGGRIEPLSADTSLSNALPPAAKPSQLVKHELAEYGEATARPLFFSDRRPKPFSLQPGGEAGKTDTFDYVLSSVLIAPGLRMAILQPQEGGESIRFKLGEDSEKLPGWHLTELTPRSATFASASETRVLELRVFDGSGGQPPTALPSVQPVPRATQATMPVPPPSPKPEPAPPAQAQQPPRAVSAQPPETPPQAEADAAPPSPNESQLQAIRQRIEARRAKLRQESQQADKPKN